MQPDWIVEMLERLEPDLREDFEERAAIMQYDGNMPREHAECLAQKIGGQTYTFDKIASWR